MNIKSFIEYEMNNQKVTSIEGLGLSWSILDESTENQVAYLQYKFHYSSDFITNFEPPLSSPLLFNHSYPPYEKRNQILSLVKSLDDDFTREPYTKYKNSSTATKILKLLRKPKIVFLGKSDVGKSSFINNILGSKLLPVGWTPTTSIITRIRHIEEKPDYVTGPCCIFKECNDAESIDEIIKNQVRYKDVLVAEGSTSLLLEYGTNKIEDENRDNVYTAVIYLDNAFLKNCEIFDVPGITSGMDSDNKKASDVIDDVDILVYLSNANSFLSEGDFNYLENIIPRYRERVKNNGTISHEMYIATQVDSLREEFDTKSQLILDKGSERLNEHYKKRQIPKGYYEELRKHFFAYSTLIRFDGKSKLEKAFSDLFEGYYKWVRENLIVHLSNITKPIVSDQEQLQKKLEELSYIKSKLDLIKNALE